MRLMALLLVALGLLALGIGAFSYTHEKGEIKIGPLQIQVTEREQVDIPLWAGVGSIVLGGLLLVVRKGSASH